MFVELSSLEWEEQSLQEVVKMLRCLSGNFVFKFSFLERQSKAKCQRCSRMIYTRFKPEWNKKFWFCFWHSLWSKKWYLLAIVVIIRWLFVLLVCLVWFLSSCKVWWLSNKWSWLPRVIFPDKIRRGRSFFFPAITPPGRSTPQIESPQRVKDFDLNIRCRAASCDSLCVGRGLLKSCQVFGLLWKKQEWDWINLAANELWRKLIPAEEVFSRSIIHVK